MLSMNFHTVLLCTLVFLISFSIQAKTYRCTDNDGKVSYGTSPCIGDAQEKELQGVKETTEYDPIKAEKDKAALESASQRMKNWENYKENKRLEALEQAISNLPPSAQVSARLKLYQASKNKNRNSTIDDDEVTNRLNSQKTQMESEMRMKQMQMENQQRMEIHRMESQQRLKEAFPPPWSR